MGFLDQRFLSQLRQPQPAPSFAHRPGVWSGVHRLIETPMAINGLAPTPDFVFVGGDASAGGWSTRTFPASPVTLTLQAGTAPTYNAGSPLLGAYDDSIQFNAGGYFQATGNSFADLTTEDIVFEAIIKVTTTGGNRRVCDKRGTGAGWTFIASAGAIQLFISDGSNTGTITNVAASESWHHILAFVDRSGSGIAYVDTVAGTAVSVSAVGSITKATPFTIGAVTGGSSTYDRNVAYLALWKLASWLNSHLQPTVVAQRFALVSGAKPLSSWAGDTGPTTAGTTSLTYQEKIVSSKQQLFQMGVGIPRFVQQADVGGQVSTGSLVEPGATNLAPNSQNLANWSASSCTASTTAVVCPDGYSNIRATLHESTSGVTTHSLSEAVAILDTTAYTFSCFLKAAPSGRSWAQLEVNNGAFSSYFNLSTGAVGTISGAGATASTRTYGNGWYRCWITFTSTSVTGLPKIYAATADGGSSYAGTNIDSIYAFGAQLETGVYPTSYVRTLPASAVRVADGLMYYNLTNILSAAQDQGAIRFRCLFPADLPTAYPTQCLAQATRADGTQRLHVYRPTGGAILAAHREPDNVDTNSTVSVLDGKIHEVMLAWLGKRLDIWVDGTLATATMTNSPSAMTQLHIGNCVVNNQQAGPAIVSDVKVFPAYQMSWETRGSGFEI